MNTTQPNPPPPLPGDGGNAVTATRLTRRYGTGPTAVEALRGVSPAVRHGELAAIMGPSGSGKSTLLHILAGLDRPTSGEVTIGGRALAGLGDRDLTLLRRTQVGFVFQFFNLLPMLTAEGNIVLPLKLAGERPDPAWVDELIGNLGLRGGNVSLVSQSVDSRNHALAGLAVTAGLIGVAVHGTVIDTVIGLMLALTILKSCADLTRDLIGSQRGGQQPGLSRPPILTSTRCSANTAWKPAPAP